MPSSYIKGVIKNTAKACAVAAIPGAFLPGIDVALVGGYWLNMMNKIADDHRVTFSEEPIRFVGTIVAGVGAYWTGSKIFTWGIAIIVGVLTAGVGAAIIVPVINVILNAYFTWSVGRKMDDIFAANSGTKATETIARQIIKTVCHVPSRGEFSEFWDEVSLSLSEIKNWFK